jgi:hypothetical protein
MNELCKAHEPHLTLYAEGELTDSATRDRVELHLNQCRDCQEWVRDYQDFTLQIAGELERAQRYRVGDVSRPSTTDFERLDAIMAAVHGGHSQRGRNTALRALAAASLVLVLAGLLWWSRDRGPSDHVAQVADRGAAVAGLMGGNQVLVGAPATIDTPESEPFASDLELVSWLLGDEFPAGGATPADPGEVELLGVMRRYRRGEDGHWFVVTESESSPVRWVLTARLREEFLDPLGGGWTFLVPEDNARATPVNATPRDSSTAIPLKRVGLQSVPRHRPRYVSHRPAADDTTHYRIIVVPDERGLGEEMYYRPATPLPEDLFRDPMESLPTY